MLAAGQIRLVLSRASVTKLLQNGPKILGVGPMQIPVATMRATHGEKYPYDPNPWPYERKKFRTMHHLFDYTMDRLNENSKVIVIEGNVGVGKHDFAKKLAQEFDLKYFPGTPHSNCFEIAPGFDWRSMNEFFPDTLKGYDVQRFLADPNPECGRVGLLVNNWFIERCKEYCMALTHLLSTGQGVVMVKSPFSDIVYTHALRQMGWVSRNFVKYFKDIQDAALSDLLHPHLTIYLDASIPTLQSRIKKRNNPTEVNGVNLTAKYLTEIELAYKDVFFASMKNRGHIMQIEWETVADRVDMDAIAEEISQMKLEAEDNEDPKFWSWNVLDEEEMCYLRTFYGTPAYLIEDNFCGTGGKVPWSCPEILMNEDDAQIFHDIVVTHPAYADAPGWSKRLGDMTTWRV